MRYVFPPPLDNAEDVLAGDSTLCEGHGQLPSWIRTLYIHTVQTILCLSRQREYTVLTATQTTAYQQPRNALPHFLTNQPSSVTSACLLNIQKVKQ